MLCDISEKLMCIIRFVNKLDKYVQRKVIVNIRDKMIMTKNYIQPALIVKTKKH